MSGSQCVLASALLCAVFSSSWGATPAAVALSVSPNPATYGARTALTAEVSPAGATGNVTFYYGVSVAGVAPLTGGTATLETITLPPGSHSLRARYNGDATHSASTSAAVPLTVRSTPGQGFVRVASEINPNLPFPQLAAGDFNGDGKLDVLATDRLSMLVRLFTGKGDATYSLGGTFSPGYRPYALAVADFNGDSLLDAVILDESAEKGTVLFGNGQGAFQAGPSIAVRGVEAGAGDFNRDGAVDLAVLAPYGTAPRLTVLLGKGDGTFPARADYALESRAGSFAMADVNGDEIPDLILTMATRCVGIMPGNGDGSFGVLTGRISFDEDVNGVTTGDFNNDGRADLAVSVGSSVATLLGNGDGSFVTPRIVAIGNWTYQVKTTDLNGDGNDDLVVETTYPIDPSIWEGTSFVALVGDGSGALALSRYYNGLSNSPSNGPFLLGDLNGDGRVDVTQSLGAGISVFAGLAPSDLSVTSVHTDPFEQGKSASYTLTVTNLGPNATSTRVSLMDTLPEGIVYAGASGSGWNCSGGMQSASCQRFDPLPPGAAYPAVTLQVVVSSIAPPSVTNTATVSVGGMSDGNPANDIASDVTTILQYQTIVFGVLPDRRLGDAPFPVSAHATSGLEVTFTAQGGCTVEGAVVTLISTGTCTITASQAGNALYFPAAAVSRTFIIGEAATSISLRSTPNPSALGAPVTLTATVSPASAAGVAAFYDGAALLGTAPVNGGVAMLTVRPSDTGIRRLTARFRGTAPYPGSLSAPVPHNVRSTPAFAFQDTNIPSITFGSDVIAGDFNGDAVSDLAVASGYGVYVYPGKTSGGFDAAVLSVDGAPNLSPIRIAAGDFDGDGKLDVAMANAAFANAPASLRVRFGNGDGTFGPAVSYPIEDGPLAAADFSGDGLADLAVGHASRRNVAVFVGRADRSFDAPAEYGVSGDGSEMSLAAGDMNGDGAPDLVAVTTKAPLGNPRSQIDTLLGRGDGTFASSVAPVADSVETPIDARPMALGDLNGDGVLDIVIQNSFSYGSYCCSITILLGNGDGTYRDPAQVLCSDASPASVEYQVSAAGSPAGLTIADVDGDGRPDVAAAFTFNSIFLQVFPGNGDGTFQSAAIHCLNTFDPPYGLVSGDFNGDGRIDLVSRARTNLRLATGSEGPSLRAVLTHTGGVNGLSRFKYTATISNASGAQATTGKVSVIAALPAYGNLVLTGDGWDCSSWTCSREDSLAGGASYPPITIMYDAIAALSPDKSSVVVSGGGSAPAMAFDFAMLELAGAPRVDSVNTASAFGPVIAQNAFLEIKGANLVPPTTPAAGVTWGDAPDFASGRMPTELGGVSVTVNGRPGFVSFYCSAATSAVCASDQVNVLAPLDDATGPVDVVVTSGGVSSAPFPVTLVPVMPSFLRLGATAYATASHADYSLLAPRNLYPGISTPAAPGEVAVLWAVGFGLPVPPLTNGSSSQFGVLQETPVCTVAGYPADAVGYLVAPGLYQLNVTIPEQTPSGDNPVRCTYLGSATVPGTWITVER